jgi:putative transposase
VVKQDHRAIERITRPMPGFKDFRCARIILSGIEVMHMIRKGQMKTEDGAYSSATGQFHSMLV